MLNIVQQLKRLSTTIGYPVLRTPLATTTWAIHAFRLETSITRTNKEYKSDQLIISIYFTGTQEQRTYIATRVHTHVATSMPTCPFTGVPLTLIQTRIVTIQ